MILDVKVPAVGESITEVTLAEWLVEDGEYVEMDQPICEMETDKASQELFAEKAGTVQRVAEEGDDIEVGGLICKIDTSAKAPDKPKAEKKVEEAPKKEAPKVENKPKKEETKSYDAKHTTPVAAQIIEQNNLDANAIKASNESGRVTKADVLKAIEDGTATMENAYATLINQKPAFARTERREKVSRLRKTIADRLVYAKNTTAMLTTFNEVDCTAMMATRSKYKEKFKEKHGVGLGFMSFFTKAVTLSLQKYPAVNAYLDIEEKQVIYHDYVDISIAVSTPKGLVVPVIRNAESLTLQGIEKEVKRLAIMGRDGDLTMDDMQGGTFTISNGGVFGSLLSTPILNPPQSAILGMHKIEERPIAVNGKVEIRKMMYVALSYDHRIIDGKESVSFLVSVKDYLENPEKMLLGGDPVELLLNI